MHSHKTELTSCGFKPQKCSPFTTIINNKSSNICIYSFYKAIIISSKYDVDVLMILFTAMKRYDTQKYKGYSTIKDNQPVPLRIKTYDPQPYRNFTDRITEERLIPEIKQYVAEKFISKISITS